MTRMSDSLERQLVDASGRCEPPLSQGAGSNSLCHNWVLERYWTMLGKACLFVVGKLLGVDQNYVATKTRVDHHCRPPIDGVIVVSNLRATPLFQELMQ